MFVFLVCVGPSLFGAVASQVWRLETFGNFVYQATERIFLSVCTVSVVLFVVSRSGDPWRSFGFLRPRLVLDPLIGIGIMGLSWISYTAFWFAMESVLKNRNAMLAGPRVEMFALPSGSFQYLLLAAMSVSNGAAEELVLRGYLLTRFEQLTRSTVAAILVTSALFACYHIYQGAGSALGVGVLGLIYAAMFCLTRRIWPVIVAHALQDFLSLAMRAMQM